MTISRKYFRRRHSSIYLYSLSKLRIVCSSLKSNPDIWITWDRNWYAFIILWIPNISYSAIRKFSSSLWSPKHVKFNYDSVLLRCCLFVLDSYDYRSVSSYLIFALVCPSADNYNSNSYGIPEPITGRLSITPFAYSTALWISYSYDSIFL